MKGSQWAKLKSLVEAALQMPEQERVAFLDNACEGDTQLRKEVAALIEVDLSDMSFIDKGLLRRPPMEGQAKSIGPYRIIEEIGRGGVGAVFLARREDGDYHKLVAVKIIKRGMDADGIIEKFLQERMILAGLTHPNIAQIIDGGTTDEGAPYFVMEYVYGKPLLKYCDDNRLTLRERLQLFGKICDAVHFAHQNLVLHRDLKPANILVDCHGEPKLLDFGIAKALTPDRRAAETNTEFRMFTPGYASPEQARGEPTATPSDVYSLGVTLFELLTGQKPYQVQGGFGADVAWEILQSEAPKPSALFTRSARRSHSDLNPEKAAKARSATVSKIKRQLGGDVDKIVLKALRKEISRRYASVERLAEDIQRYLNGFPVRARGDSWYYVVQKFIRRNKISVGFSLAALLIPITYGFARILEQRETARQRDRAETEATLSREVIDFMVELFEYAGPDRAMGESVTAKEILDRGANQIELGLSRQPLVRAALMSAMGDAYLRLGLYTEARPLIEEALATRRGQLTNNHPDFTDNLELYGLLKLNMGQFEEAAAEFEEALRILQEASNPDLPKIADTHLLLGGAYQQTTTRSRAWPHMVKALTIQRKLNPSPHPKWIQSLTAIANFLADEGKTEEARVYLDEALELHGKGKQPTFSTVEVSNLISFAGIAVKIGALEDAERLQRECLALCEAFYKRPHHYWSLSLANLGSLRFKRGKIREASELFRQALAMKRTLLRPDHPNLINAQINLGSALGFLGNYEEAEKIFKQATAYDQPPYLIKTIALANLAEFTNLRGRPEKALTLLRQAEALTRNIHGGKAGYLVFIYNNQAKCLLSLGRTSQANEKIQAAFKLIALSSNERHPHLPATLRNYSMLQFQLGNLEVAEQISRDGLWLRKELYGDRHYATAVDMTWLADILAERGKWSEGEHLARTAIEILEENWLQGHPFVDDAYAALGACLSGLDEYPTAEMYLTCSLEAYMARNPESAEVNRASSRLIFLYKNWGMPEKARRLIGRYCSDSMN